MKKIILIALIAISSVFSSPFNAGYKDGYEDGYCKDIFGCLTPLTPLPPLTQIGENPNSYQDGYQRGFLDGYRANH
jgi:hypothetical protein